MDGLAPGAAGSSQLSCSSSPPEWGSDGWWGGLVQGSFIPATPLDTTIPF